MQKKEMYFDIRFLENSLSSVSSELSRLKKLVPEDSKLRAAKNGNSFQFFIRKKGATDNGVYIKKENRKTAATLAQIEYDEKLKKVLEASIASLSQWKEKGGQNPFATALQQLAPCKRALVKLPFLDNEDYLTVWKNQTYKGLDFPAGFPEYYNRQGLRVRSKSEVILTDILDEMSLPFLYEKPLLLHTGLVHPDFTLLNIKKRKEVYWEHFGMMDDADYRNSAFLKIRKYEANGYYQPTSLIWTFETGKYPLNVKEIRKMVAELKKEFGYEE